MCMPYYSGTFVAGEMCLSDWYGGLKWPVSFARPALKPDGVKCSSKRKTIIFVTITNPQPNLVPRSVVLLCAVFKPVFPWERGVKGI